MRVVSKQDLQKEEPQKGGEERKRERSREKEQERYEGRSFKEGKKKKWKDKRRGYNN